MKKIVILGGGIGGLSAAWMLSKIGKYDITVIEKSSVLGGVCGTFSEGAFHLDYGPHKFYSIIPGIMDEIKSLMGDELILIEKKNSIFLFNSFLKYPLSMLELLTRMGIKNMAGSAISMIKSILSRNKTQKIESYEDFIIDKFGKKLYELVFKPLADKTWGSPSTISADIARTRIPSSSFIDILLRLTHLKKESKTTDAKYFLYPKSGFGRITDRMAEEIKKNGGVILTETLPVKIEMSSNNISGVHVKTKGNTGIIACDLMISSIPLNALVEIIDEKTAGKAIESVKSLQYRSAILVYLVINKERLTSQHWIFFPGPETIFARIFEQKCISRDMIPQDKTVICCDFTDFKDGALTKLSDKELADRCATDLEKVGILQGKSVEKFFIKRLPDFYPRYDIHYKNTIQQLYDSILTIDNIILTGRIGFYNYNNADHCIDMGKFIAQNISEGNSTRRIMSGLENRVANYRIVD